MEEVRTFLASSTIHGLAYIGASNRRLVKSFWIFVVISGFIISALMICQSFKAWSENPVTTTIETRPITEIKFPKVTVCPPKNTVTDLNHDILTIEKLFLNNLTRIELRNYALELLYDHVNDIIVTNLSMLQNKDMNYNWYHGYTYIQLPTSRTDYNVHHFVNTYATSGNITTQYFGDKFDVMKVERDISCYFSINSPKNIRDNSNVTLHFEIDKISMRDLSKGKDRFYFDSDKITADEGQVYRNFSPPGFYHHMQLHRKVSNEDVNSNKLEKMPGLRLRWYYTGMEVQPEPYFSEINDNTKSFIRNISRIIH